ncbi:hypothetical protein BDW71DRAFT_204842 [Aspergillus fruticulosus]
MRSLTPAQKDDLASLAASRAVVVFRDQDFADIGPVRKTEWARRSSTRLKFHSQAGDSLYLSTTAAYENLSEVFRSHIEGPYAMRSGFSQAAAYDHWERYTCEPIETVHLVVRKHPVTKKNGLYVNRLYTSKIVRWKEEESHAIINFPYDQIEKGQDWRVRIQFQDP